MMNLGNLGIKSIIAALLLAVTGTITNTYFCEGSIWYKDDAQGERHFVFLIGDAHIETRNLHQEWDKVFKEYNKDFKSALIAYEASQTYKRTLTSTKNTHAQFVEYLNTRKLSRGIKVIVEDLEESKINEIFCQHRIIDEYCPPRPSLLSFSSVCEQYKIPFINVEFRYLPCIERGMNLSNTTVSQKFLDIFDTCTIDSKQQLNNVVVKLEELKAPKCLYEWLVEGCTYNIKLREEYRQTFLKLNAKLTKDQITELNKRLVHSYSFTLDLKTLIEIYQNKNSDLFVLEGFCHISRIEQIMPQLGYTKLAIQRDANSFLYNTFNDMWKNIQSKDGIFYESTESEKNLMQFLALADKKPETITNSRYYIAQKILTASLYAIPVTFLFRSAFTAHQNGNRTGEIGAHVLAFIWCYAGFRNIFFFPKKETQHEFEVAKTPAKVLPMATT
jgi:hypothetical protein